MKHCIDIVSKQKYNIDIEIDTVSKQKEVNMPKGSKKQRKAMDIAEVNYVYMSIYEITFAEIKRLLNI